MRSISLAPNSTLPVFCSIQCKVIYCILSWCWVDTVRAATVFKYSFYWRPFLVSLSGAHVLYILITYLHIIAINVLCSRVVMEAVGRELCSHVLFASAESLISDPLTQHPRQPSPLSMSENAHACVRSLPWVKHAVSLISKRTFERGVLLFLHTRFIKSSTVQMLPSLPLYVCPCLWYMFITHSVFAKSGCSRHIYLK